jgi:hypothetical protein
MIVVGTVRKGEYDDPLYEPWREAMEEYRRQLDQDPEAL